MIECSQKECSKPAQWSYVWPGKAERLFACDACFGKAESIMGAMGLYLGDVRELVSAIDPAEESE